MLLPLASLAARGRWRGPGPAGWRGLASAAGAPAAAVRVRRGGEGGERAWQDRRWTRLAGWTRLADLAPHLPTARQAPPTVKLLIDGQLRESQTKEWISVVNPVGPSAVRLWGLAEGHPAGGPALGGPRWGSSVGLAQTGRKNPRSDFENLRPVQWWSGRRGGAVGVRGPDLQHLDGGAGGVVFKTPIFVVHRFVLFRWSIRSRHPQLPAPIEALACPWAAPGRLLPPAFAD
jgi:hypothetical protein